MSVRRALAALLASAAVLLMAGCGPKDESFDPNKIVKKQPGSGPPPMGQPMSQPKGASGR